MGDNEHDKILRETITQLRQEADLAEEKKSRRRAKRKKSPVKSRLTKKMKRMKSPRRLSTGEGMEKRGRCAEPPFGPATTVTGLPPECVSDDREEFDPGWFLAEIDRETQAVQKKKEEADAEVARLMELARVRERAQRRGRLDAEESDSSDWEIDYNRELDMRCLRTSRINEDDRPRMHF